MCSWPWKTCTRRRYGTKDIFCKDYIQPDVQTGISSALQHSCNAPLPSLALQYQELGKEMYLA